MATPQVSSRHLLPPMPLVVMALTTVINNNNTMFDTQVDEEEHLTKLFSKHFLPNIALIFTMSVNKYMHPRNIYKIPPDFKELALSFPEFKPYVKLDVTGKPIFDFKNPDALRALSYTLLKKDFNLDVEIPKNKLVPTIPLRLNYILWIEDLLNFIQRLEDVKGVDIGTGASCVYPLIAAKKNQWAMIATETDLDSIQYARRNVEKNNLQNLITIIEAPQDSLLTNIIDQEQEYDFCMCNPPFFASTQELHPFFKSRKLNRPHPKNAFIASINEVVSKGGELDFIQKIINESKDLKTRIRIFSTMVGQKSHLPALKKSLREARVYSFKEMEFCQGNTTRWGLAWTYNEDYDLRKMPDQVKLTTKPAKKPGPLLYKLPDQESGPENAVKVANVILKMFKDLQMTFEEVTRNKLHHRYFVTAYSNTWSHQRRKRRDKQRKISDNNPENNNVGNSEPETSPDTKLYGKRDFEDICESTIKKLRLSTESESSEMGTVFYKFMFAINCMGNEIILELDTVDDIGNRDYLHQIVQYIKNNFTQLKNEI